MYLLSKTGKPIRKIKAEPLTKTSISKGMIACHQTMFVKKKYCPTFDLNFPSFSVLKWTIILLQKLLPKEIQYIPTDHIFYKSGGFSDRIILPQLKEHLILIYRYYGLGMILWRLPRLIRRYGGKWLRNTLGIYTLRFWIKPKQ